MSVQALYGLFADPVTARKKTFFSIDILRGLAALSILIFHFGHFTRGGGELSRPESLIYDVSILHALSWIVDFGGLAVMLFWMISGFVFMNVYAGAKPGLRSFAINRFSRLYPLHLLTLLSVALIQLCSLSALGHYVIYQVNDLYHFVLQLFFASEWGLQRGRSFNGPIWSVSIEMLIYFVFYLYVRLCRVSAITTGGGILAFALLLVLLPGNLVALCGLYFFSGMAAYIAYAHICSWAPRHLLLLFTPGALALFVIVAASRLLHLPLTLWLVPVFGFMLIVLATSEDQGRMHDHYSRLRAVGDITYSTYLWHSPLQMIFLLGAGVGWWSVDIAFSNLFLIAYVCFVALFSYASFLWVERPAQTWLRRRLSPIRPVTPRNIAQPAS